MRWKIRVMSYKRFVDSEIKAAGNIQTMAAGRAVLDCFEGRWEQTSDAYAKLEIDCPEPEDLDNQAPEAAVIYIQRRIQWEDAAIAHDRGYRAIVDRIAALQAAAEPEDRVEPTRSQQVEMATHKRYWLYRETRKRVERLGEGIAAEEDSAGLAVLEYFDAERKEIRRLINQLEEMENAAH